MNPRVAVRPRRHPDSGLIAVEQGTYQGKHGLFDVTFNPDDLHFYVHPHGSHEVLRMHSTLAIALNSLAFQPMPPVIEVERPTRTPSRFLPAVIT